MNILYIHGFGSRFDRSSEKIATLSQLGPVAGVNLDWSAPAQQNIDDIAFAMKLNESIDLLVGTSMGGWGAATVGALYGIPFVAINPAVSPQDVLRQRIGEGNDYEGRPYTLTEETLSTYKALSGEGYGLILLDEGDEVIPARPTFYALKEYHDINMFEGGSHRFDHMQDALPIIREFCNKASTSYGNDIV